MRLCCQLEDAAHRPHCDPTLNSATASSLGLGCKSGKSSPSETRNILESSRCNMYAGLHQRGQSTCHQIVTIGLSRNTTYRLRDPDRSYSDREGQCTRRTACPDTLASRLGLCNRMVSMAAAGLPAGLPAALPNILPTCSLFVLFVRQCTVQRYSHRVRCH